jgi:hypothetical protein
LEGALASGFAITQLHHAPGHDPRPGLEPDILRLVQVHLLTRAPDKYAPFQLHPLTAVMAQER